MATGEYGIVYKGLWRKQRFIGVGEDGHKLLLFLFTGDYGNLFGLFYFHIYHICAEPAFEIYGWGPERTQAAFNELLKAEWVQYDRINKMLLVKNWFDSRNIISGTQLKKALSQLANLPFTPLLEGAIKGLDSKDCKISKGLRQGLRRALTERLERGSVLGLRLGLGATSLGGLPITETGTGTETETPESDDTPLKTVTADQVREFAELFNKENPKHPQVKIGMLTEEKNPKRIKHVKRRLMANPKTEFWLKVFEEIKASGWLSGRIPGKDGGKPFKVTFDWMINPANLTKIIEGNYRDERSKNGSGTAQGGNGSNAKALRDKYARPRGRSD